MKKILVDINHPAHVHLFKYFISEMRTNGYQVKVTAKNVSSIKNLLDLYEIDYVSVGNKKDHLVFKYIYEFIHLVRVLYIAISEKIDYGIGVSMVLPLVSKLSSMKSIALDDDDIAVTPISARFISLANVILNPSALAYEHRGTHRICYPSYHELAYLHPDRFIPDPGVLDELNLRPDEPFFVLRFNAFKAHHDAGIKGLSLEQKLKIIDILSRIGKVFVTTERITEPELQAYQLTVSPEKIHSLLYYATLFVGDSQTMTTEAALLGTPSVKLNSFSGKLAIPNELENKYQLCYSFLPQEFDKMLDRIKEILVDKDVKEIWRIRRNIMLNDKMDLTSFLIWFISSYPGSLVSIKPALLVDKY